MLNMLNFIKIFIVIQTGGLSKNYELYPIFEVALAP
jgi:hypothetical protein